MKRLIFLLLFLTMCGSVFGQGAGGWPPISYLRSQYNTYSVMDYGAVGDSSTNDRAAIQACLDAVPATGGIVIFPPGQYRITDSILQIARGGDDNVHVFGYGARIICDEALWGGGMMIVSGDSTDFAENCEIAGFIFHDYFTDSCYNNATGGAWMQGGAIYDNVIERATHKGISLHWSDNVDVYSNVVDTAGQNSIIVENSQKCNNYGGADLCTGAGSGDTTYTGRNNRVWGNVVHYVSPSICTSPINFTGASGMGDHIVVTNNGSTRVPMFGNIVANNVISGKGYAAKLYWADTTAAASGVEFFYDTTGFPLGPDSGAGAVGVTCDSTTAALDGRGIWTTGDKNSTLIYGNVMDTLQGDTATAGHLSPFDIRGWGALRLWQTDSTTRTNYGRIVAKHFDWEEEDISVIEVITGDTDTYTHINYGAFPASVEGPWNVATHHRFLIGDSTTDTSGTIKLIIDSTGINSRDYHYFRSNPNPTTRYFRIGHTDDHSYLNAVGGDLRLQIDGSTKWSIDSTGQMIDGSLKYPTADGTANQVIETDGSGNLSFATAPGAAGGDGAKADTGDASVQIVDVGDHVWQEGTGIQFDIDANDTITITASALDLWKEGTDTLFGKDSDDDTMLAVWDDDAGNVRLQTATEDQTLRILADTIGIGGDVISEFAGTGLTVVSNELTVDLGVAIDSTEVTANSLSMPSDVAAFTEAELEARLSDVTNVIQEDEIDAGSELLAIYDDETGTGVPVFNISPTFTGTVTSDYNATDTIFISGDTITDFNGSGLAVSAGVLSATGGGAGLWDYMYGTNPDSIKYASTEDIIHIVRDVTNDTTHLRSGSGTLNISGGTGNPIIADDLGVYGNITVNDDATTADAVIYFEDDDETTSIHWDDANDRFEVSNTTYFGGEVIADTDVKAYADITINADYASGDEDASLFFNTTSQYLEWNYGADNFVFSDDVDITGNLVVSDIIGSDVTFDSVNSTDIIALTQLRAECDIHGEDNIYVNKDSTTADAVIYFGDDDEVVSMHWDDPNDRFETSDALYVTGALGLSGTLTASAPNFTLTMTADSAQFDGNVDIDSMDINGVLDVTGAITAGSTIDGVDLGALNTDVAADSGSWNATADALGTAITSAKITDQEIVKADIDTTSGFVVASAHKVTSAEADSAFMTKAYVDAAAGGLVDQSVKGDHVDSTAENFVFSDAFRVTSAVADSVYMTKAYIDGLAGAQDFADVLGEDPDGGDIDQTSLGKLEFFDAGLFLDADADAVMLLSSDGTLELASADWNISTTGVQTNMGNITSDGTVEGATITEGGNAVYNATETPGGVLGGTWASPTIDVDAVAYDDIGDPDASGSIAMGAHTGTYTTATDGWGGIIINNTTAELTASTTLLTLKYTDDGDAQGKFLSIVDATNQEKFYIGQHGALVMGSAGITEPELEILDDATVTTAELNKLDADVDGTLQDIADGTIAEDLDNTTNPWAANEIVSTVIHNDEMDASSELLAIMDDETGSAAGSPLLVFNYGPTFNHKITADSLVIDSIGVQEIDVGGSITVTGTVDGIDVGALDADVAADSASWNATADALGTTIVTGNITDGTILEADLNVTNAPTGLDNYVLTLNEGSNNFTWAVDATAGGFWTEGTDTLFVQDDDSDTMLAVWDDDAGNVRLQTATEDQTLRILADTIGLGGDVISEFAGTGLTVTSNELVADLGTSISLAELESGAYAKDIVTTAPVTGATDNVLVGADADVTLALDFTASWDFGGAAGLEIPNGADPTVNAEGEVAYETDEECLRIYDGSANRSIPTVQFVEIHPFLPDLIQDSVDQVPVLTVHSDWAPFGIKILGCGMSTGAASTYAVNFEEWSDPVTLVSTIEAGITTSGGTEDEDDGTIDDSDIATNSYVMVDLPTTQLGSWVTFWVSYYIKTGN